MSNLINRADAIEAVCRTRCGDKAKGCPAHSCLVIEEFDALPSADTHEIHTQTHECVKESHDREWIIGCIKHDGFIKTDRFDKANQIILDALQFAEHFDLLKEYQSLQEVVYCKDCKHYSVKGRTTQFGFCEYRHAGTDETDYCSRGERREP